MPFARTASYIRLAAMASLWGVLTLACLAQEPQPPAAPTAQNTPEARPLPALNYVETCNPIFLIRWAPTFLSMWPIRTSRTRRASTSLCMTATLPFFE